jgi:ribosomal protein L11 methyltransferase
MKTSGVSKISIITTAECEEPIAALLERIFSVAPTIYSDAETHQSTVTAYVRATPAKLRARSPEIKSSLDELQKLGLDLGRREVQVSAVRKEDWAESWKKHFKPLRIGSALLIQPSWSKLKPKNGQAVVTLDPGLSFGTGQHATTDFCLHQIVAIRRRVAQNGSLPPALLDIGCGSGILAISAAKLGYASVGAFDFDPVAVRITQKNCRINRVEKKITVTRKDLTKVPLNSRQKYDVICANLMAPLLITERDRILNRLAPTGTLILAGILATEFNSVRGRYESAGLKLIAEKSEREWQSGAFIQNSTI